MLMSTTISTRNVISSPAKSTNRDAPLRWPNGAQPWPDPHLEFRLVAPNAYRGASVPILSDKAVEWVHLRSFHRGQDRRTVWGSSSLVGSPNGLQLFNELVCVGLGFPPCCKGIERCVSHLHVLGNAPSIAAMLPGVSCDIDCEDIGAFSSGAVAEGAALGVTVTRIVAHCVARSARDLLQAVEQGGTCLGHAGIGSLAARHHRPAAFFDIRRLLPRVGLFQRRQVHGGVGAALELVDADRRDRGNHGATGCTLRQGLRRASEHPPAPAEANGESRGDADGGALQEPLQRFSLIPSQGLHKTLLLIGAEGFRPFWVIGRQRGI